MVLCVRNRLHAIAYWFNVFPAATDILGRQPAVDRRQFLCVYLGVALPFFRRMSTRFPILSTHRRHDVTAAVANFGTDYRPPMACWVRLGGSLALDSLLGAPRILTKLRASTR